MVRLRGSISLTTMAFSTRTKYIAVALVIAASSVGAAFLLSGHSVISQANAGSTEELLKAYASKDTDGDGLMDWQESLYGTDEKNAHSVDATLTDKAAVEQGLVKPKFESEKPELSEGDIPGTVVAEDTLTDRFAKEFFGTYLQEQDAGTPSEADVQAFVNSEIAKLPASEGAHYSSSSVTKVAGGEEALRTYAADAEGAFALHTVSLPKGELEYFEDAVYRDDATALANIKRISDAYTGVASAFVKVKVPSEAAVAHLRAANALSRIGAIEGDMAAFGKDPLRGFVGLGSYEAAVTELNASFADLYKVFASAGVVLEPADAGYSVYSLTEAAARHQP